MLTNKLILFNNVLNNSIFKIISINNKNVYKSFHSTPQIFDSSKKINDKNENLEFQKDVSSGIRNLEKLGLLKPHMSWPQYNRIIYPPTEDGKPMKNPVILTQYAYF
jgi:hypothetical protein